MEALGRLDGDEAVAGDRSPPPSRPAARFSVSATGTPGTTAALVSSAAATRSTSAAVTNGRGGVVDEDVDGRIIGERAERCADGGLPRLPRP